MPKNKLTRKLTVTGQGSFTLVIPADHVRALGWREHQKLIVKKVPRGVLILDALTKKRKKSWV